MIHGHLTEKGKQLMEEIFPQHEKAMAYIFSSLSNEEKEQAIDLLKRVGLFAEKL